MAVRRMRITCWITKAASTLRISLRESLHERAFVGLCTCIACLVEITLSAWKDVVVWTRPAVCRLTVSP
jgi:hypothetical protein